MEPVVTIPLRDLFLIMIAADFIMPDLEALVVEGQLSARVAVGASCAFDRAADFLDGACGPGWENVN